MKQFDSLAGSGKEDDLKSQTEHEAHNIEAKFQ